MYSNGARSVSEARQEGLDNGAVRDPSGHVAEFSYTNPIYAKNDVVHITVPNGMFLNDITCQRIIQLLLDDGIDVQERVIGYDDLSDADELFETGNYSKVMPCVMQEDWPLQPGPLYAWARDLYPTSTDSY